MLYWNEGLALLNSLIPPDQVQALNRNEAVRKAEQNASISEDLNKLVQSSESYLVLADQIPRRRETALNWREETQHFFSGGILPFINDIEDDPHTRHYLACLHGLIDDLGIDPTDALTTGSWKPETIIVCGCGDGNAMMQLINHFKPDNLFILLDNWEDLASSFGNVNWVTLWNEYCASDTKSVSAISSNPSNAVLHHLFFHHAFSLDHALIYESPVASDGTKELAQHLRSGWLDRIVAYTGFPMDEYNMLWNSWKSLSKNPIIFQKPVHQEPKGDFLIIGSGPSLDANLDWIYENQENFIIVSCASNYGSLRKADIKVDVLCLLERGDFMIEQYTDLVNAYGADNTSLFASITTPAEILDLFSSSMVYFRPSLTPYSLFAENDNQVLTAEGPQTVNTGVAFALTQSPRRVILCGVDLGTASLDNVRTSNAIGESPREFDKTVKGNLRDLVYTNDMLMDGVVVLETCRNSVNDQVELINCSDGVYIKGFMPMELPDVDIKVDGGDFSRTQSWWMRQKIYSFDFFEASYYAAQPRRVAVSMISSLRRALSDSSLESWNNVRRMCQEILFLNDKPKYEQFASRVIRGLVYRLLIAVNREIIILAKTGAADQQKFLTAALPFVINCLDALEREILDLLDRLELKQQLESSNEI